MQCTIITHVSFRLLDSTMITKKKKPASLDLENFKNMIQTIALDQTEEAEFKDQTIPNYKWIETVSLSMI